MPIRIFGIFFQALSLVGFDLLLQVAVSSRVAIVGNLKPNVNCAVFGVEKSGNEEVKIMLWIARGSFVNLKDSSR
jgi:hypothetical protein